MYVVEGVFNEGVGLVVGGEVEVVHEVPVLFSVVFEDWLKLLGGFGLLFG